MAAAALDVATTTGDADLELRALAQLGLAEVSAGAVDSGLARLDEAMAAATGGEPATLETFADVCCTLMLACELAGDVERPKQWSEVFEAFVRKYDHVSLLAFCRTCCADVYAANGRVDAAEQELVEALRELREAGQRSRCVHPAARLAEIRVLQGRYDEAEQLLIGFEAEPEAVHAAVALRLARGEPRAATAVLEARLGEMARSSLLAAPLLAQLVEAELAEGDVAEARRTAAELEAIAENVRTRARGGAGRARAGTHRVGRRGPGGIGSAATSGEPVRSASLPAGRRPCAPRAGPRALGVGARGRGRPRPPSPHRARVARARFARRMPRPR